MKTKITLKQIEVKKLSLKPNDVLILFVPKTEWSEQDVDQLTEALKATLPVGVGWILIRKKSNELTIKTISLKKEKK